MSFKKAHALLIGIGRYAFAPHMDVPITATDAQALGQVLRDPILCAYPENQVVSLHEATATKQGVLDALDALAKTQPEDTALVFYSGHGDYGTDGAYYLTTHDSELVGAKLKAGTGIAEHELLAKLRAIPAKRLILLFNACYAGEISQSLGPPPADEALGDKPLPVEAVDAILSTGEGRIIISACRPNQRSWIGGGTLTIFTQALIDGLSGKGYVANRGGYISAFDLYEHVYATVRDSTIALGRIQEPEITVLKGVGSFPVAVYHGATSLGTFDYQQSLPTSAGVRQVDAERSQHMLAKYVQTTIVNKQEAQGHHIAQAQGAGSSASVMDNSRSTVFDQRGQKVNTQYNVAGDFFQFRAAQDRTAAVAELRNLLEKITRAGKAGAIDEETTTDAEYQVKKAVQAAERLDASRQTIVDHLNQAKELITKVTAGVGAAAGLAAAISQAIQMVQRLF